MNMLTLTIGADAIDYCEFTHVPPAAPAVIARRAEQKLVPAVFAQIRIRFADASLTIDADRGPKQMIQPVQPKNRRLFRFSLIHDGDYTNFGGDANFISNRMRCYSLIKNLSLPQSPRGRRP